MLFFYGFFESNRIQEVPCLGTIPFVPSSGCVDLINPLVANEDSCHERLRGRTETQNAFRIHRLRTRLLRERNRTQCRLVAWQLGCRPERRSAFVPSSFREMHPSGLSSPNNKRCRRSAPISSGLFRCRAPTVFLLLEARGMRHCKHHPTSRTSARLLLVGPCEC